MLDHHRFIHLLVEDFERSDNLLKKYDVESHSSKVSEGIQLAYSIHVHTEHETYV